MRCNNKIIRFLAYFSFYSRKATGVHNKTKRQNFSKWQMTHSVGTAIVPTKRWTHTTSAASAPNGFAYFFRWFSQTENPFGFGLLFVCIVLKKESRRRPTRDMKFFMRNGNFAVKIIGRVRFRIHAMPCSMIRPYCGIPTIPISNDCAFTNHNKKKTILAGPQSSIDKFCLDTALVMSSEVMDDGWLWSMKKTEIVRNSQLEIFFFFCNFEWKQYYFILFCSY